MPAQRLGDEVLLLERGDDDGDALALDHRPGPTRAAPRVPSLQEGVGDRGGERAEEQADQAADRGGVAAARRRRLARHGGLHDLALLDVLGEREQLLVLEQLLLHRAAPLLGEADRVVEAADHDQLVGRRDALVGDDRLLLLDGVRRCARRCPRARSCSRRSACSSSSIFWSTYVETTSITDRASEFAAFSALCGRGRVDRDLDERRDVPALARA